ncbi:hypothetical protein D3C72_1271690 [compost metagenome]
MAQAVLDGEHAAAHDARLLAAGLALGVGVGERCQGLHGQVVDAVQGLIDLLAGGSDHGEPLALFLALVAGFLGHLFQSAAGELYFAAQAFAVAQSHAGSYQ